MTKKTLYILVPIIALLFVFLQKKDNNGGEVKHKMHKTGFDKPDEFEKYFQAITSPIGKEGSNKSNYKLKELKKLRSKQSGLKASHSFNWVSRGPGNVSGRTRALIIDPSDATNNTWYAGSASGGIWKTTNSGQSWQMLSNDFPNLATSTLAISQSNPNVMYAGTGEGFSGIGMISGAGVFKTSDKGNSWNQLTNTAGNKNFEFINRIIVHPEMDDTVLVATNTGVFKSKDGGQTWDTVFYLGYEVQDLVANPLNFNTIYAGVRYLGVIKSTQMGEKGSWQIVNNGLTHGYRHEVDISEIDTSVIYVSVEAPAQLSNYYISFDAAQTFSRFEEEEGSQQHFLGNQGWFNNIVKAHPYDKNKAIIGGVTLGIVDFSGTSTVSDPQLMRVDTFNTGSYMSFINFGGNFLGGGFITSDLEDGVEIEDNDWRSIEIIFGPERSQKAHRFTVPVGEGPGVSSSDYLYQDYSQVPFEVWDTDNNIQLMVSFRDQERDGIFNLIEREYDDRISGREYIFVHGVEYDSLAASTEIGKDEGYTYKQLYFVWPTLAEDANWDTDSIPESRIVARYGSYSIRKGTTSVLADMRKNSNLHVDHHDIVTIKTNPEEKVFTIIDANDGGVGISTNNGLTWEQLTNGYNTTQFYGVSKMPGKNIYIGGMQDNGTWRSKLGEDATATTEFEFMTEGDGFEAIWHSKYANRMIASSYNNLLYVSTDTGRTWNLSIDGINGDGPFVTRIAPSKADNNLIYVAGNKGVYRHYNFGLGRFPWELTAIDDSSWSFSDRASSYHIAIVSEANPNIVWAGAGMNIDPDLCLFVSTNGGDSFDTTTIYTEAELGLLSNIYPHPTEDSTAFALFSIAERPKILRTENLGQTWNDISGFGINDTSNNGFPDVMIYSMLIFPGTPDTIWVGTELGIMESINNGEDWHLASINFPAVPVWQMKIIDKQLVLATHGLGIWTTELPKNYVGMPHFKQQMALETKIYPNPASELINIETDNNINEYVVKIFDLGGRLIQEHHSSMSKTVINSSNISEGVYLISVESGDRKSAQKLVIKR